MNRTLAVLSLLPTLFLASAADVIAQTAVASGARTAGYTIDTLDIRAHTRFLADDRLLGRGTGTEGERMAASYIVSQLVRIGLAPIGADSSFLLPIPLRQAYVDPASTVTISAGGRDAAGGGAARIGAVFRNGTDFIVNTGGARAFRSFRGNAIFLGQPVHAVSRVARERSAGRLPGGSVAVLLGALGGTAMSLVPALQEAGVAGVVLLVPDPQQFDLYVRSRGESRYFVDAAVDDPVWQPDLPVLIAGPSLTNALLGGAGISQAVVQTDEGPPVDLQRVVAADIRVDVSDVPAANAGGVLRGNDPALRDEYVVYTAHYDHLGISVPDASGDSIYNGFSDNAAGVAMLLAIAKAMRDAPPDRSVAFLFFTGEERGLLGSSYMASAPPIPLDRIVALINLDAGAPPAPPLNWRIAGGEESAALGRIAVDVAAARGWTAVLSAASPNSDYWPFLQRDVPSVFIIPGDNWENVTPDERDALRRRWDRYHQAGDHWHAEFPFAGLERYAAFAMAVGLAAANR